MSQPFPAAPWTIEDIMVWRRFEDTLGALEVWRYVAADRRDAAIMNGAGVGRQLRIDCADGFVVWMFPRWHWPIPEACGSRHA